MGSTLLWQAENGPSAFVRIPQSLGRRKWARCSGAQLGQRPAQLSWQNRLESFTFHCWIIFSTAERDEPAKDKKQAAVWTDSISLIQNHKIWTSGWVSNLILGVQLSSELGIKLVLAECLFKVLTSKAYWNITSKLGVMMSNMSGKGHTTASLSVICSLTTLWPYTWQPLTTPQIFSKCNKN